MSGRILHLPGECMYQMRGLGTMNNLPKFFNMLVQSWNTVFFGLVAFGGVYLLTESSYLLGAVLIVVGLGGACFCAKQTQAWANVKEEDLPKFGKRNRPRK